MSIHPSLNSPEKDRKPRSVLKRTERLRTMLEKGLWKEGDKVYGLVKIKAVRIKIKKEKAEKAETAAATAEGASGAPATEATETKEKTATKESASKQEKK